MNQLASKTSVMGGSGAARVLSRLSGKLPQWASLLLAIAVAWQLALFALQLLTEPSQQLHAVTTLQTGLVEASRETDISVITDAHLFGDLKGTGTDDRTELPEPGLVSDVPETTLDLTLKGTIWDSERDRAIAIIEYRNEEKVYSIGDPVVAGATLYLVEPHRVILQRAGGRLEELSLSEPSRISASARPVNRQSSRLSRRNVSRNTVLRRAADSGALSEIIRPQPHFANGRLKGYRIYPGRQRRTFAELGFRPGDLATSINGVPLTDPEQSTNLLAGIDQGSQVTVTVERNGIPEVITIDLEQISSALQKLPPGSQSR